MTREALKLALEALEASHFLIHGSETKGGLAFCMDGYYSGCFDIDSNDKQTNKAITAIKEALAQPEQKPVAVVDSTISGHIDWLCTVFPKQGTKLYTTPPQRKPLTLGQKQRLWSSVGDKPTLKDRVNAYGLAIEAAHGIKGEA